MQDLDEIRKELYSDQSVDFWLTYPGYRIASNFMGIGNLPFA